MPAANDDRLLYLLKSTGPQSAADLANRLGISAVAIRKQLNRLLDLGLVRFEDQAETVGRPKRVWSLTDSGHGRFPDTHASLTVELIGAARAVFGDDGLEKLIVQREADSLATYSQAVADTHSLSDRVDRLAEIRSREGYMAQWRQEEDGSLLLIENHCPICAAASICQGLCRAELRLFKEVIGPGATVERIDHILAGARRCAYRITPVSTAAAQ